MGPTPAESSTIVPGVPPGQIEAIYDPNRWRVGRNALFLLAAGAWVAWLATRNVYYVTTRGGAMPTIVDLLGIPTGVALVLLGSVMAIGLLRGRPRLTVTASRVKLEHSWGTSWADWSSLSEFTVTEVSLGLGQKMRLAKAHVIGSGASPKVLKRKTFVVQDWLRTPVTTLVEDLNAWRTHAGSLAPAEGPATVDEGSFGVAGFRAPWVTLGILAVLVSVFAAELRFGVEPPRGDLQPAISTLAAMGGLNRAAVIVHGEWYRFFTAPLLHSDLTHLVSNCAALLIVGWQLERLVGRAWFLALFVLGAVGGGAMSLAINPASIVSVGASGAITGLLAGAIACSFHLPGDTYMRQRIQSWSASTLLPALVPLAKDAASSHIDYAGHVGGTLAGAIVGLFLLGAWPQAERLPGFRSVAATVATAGLILAGISAVMVARAYPG